MYVFEVDNYELIQMVNVTTLYNRKGVFALHFITRVQ